MSRPVIDFDDMTCDKPGVGLPPGPAGITEVRLREQLRRALAHAAQLEAQVRQLEGECARLRRLYGVETPVLVDDETAGVIVR